MLTIQTIEKTIKEAVERYSISYKDAKYLIANVIGKEYNYVSLNMDVILFKEQIDIFFVLAKQLSQNAPLEYLINRSFFMGLDFYVNKNVLIPRNETEELVELILTHIETTGAKTILDMCCGSGCILISLLAFSIDTEGIGSDISKDAIFISKKNAKQNGVNFRSKFLESNLFECIDRKFDVIVSNPPYISTSQMKELEPSVAYYEPHLALHGGETGLDFYEEIVAQAKNYLNENGSIFFEIGYNQGMKVHDILAKHGYKDIKIQKDYADKDRIVWASIM